MANRPVFTSDGNQSLAVIEQELKDALAKDPKDYQPLRVEHLMGAGVDPATNTRVSQEIDRILPRSLRARAVGAAFFKNFLGNPVLLWELYELGAYSHGQGWIRKIKETMRPDSLASGLTDAELGLAWEIYRYNVQLMAQKGATLRRRKDSTI